MVINPYLNFNGNCKTALEFYEKCLNGKVVAMFTFEGSPMAEKMPPEAQKKIMHGRVMFGEQVLMGSDSMMPYELPKGMSVTINLNDVAEAERIFSELSAGGDVQMPIQETFWAVRFATFRDQFGVPWMINCEKPA